MALIPQPPLFMALVALLWRIWRSRNWVVFEGKQFGFPVLMRQFQQQYEEWIRLPINTSPGLSPLAAEPSKSNLMGLGGGNRVVCMWDGAVWRGSHSAGGVVLFTPTRYVWLVKGVCFPGMDDPMVVELLVLREAVWWCLELGLSEVQFEGDAKVIIDKINRADARDNRIRAVLEELQQYFHSSAGFRVRFVGRSSNRVAHSVARKALSLYPTTSRSFDFLAWLSSTM
ncbi:unnamed protein product [Linum trigynum]|uniref:RNase H type-1 domain-containing protein n=1 Tax=Linum trigynum TaxID=586398 RepID=A0AAV2ECD8_9ROSI